MGIENYAKGKDLEDAVRLIQGIIFEGNPALARARIEMKPRHIVFVKGVKHEIDLYVEIDLGDGYRLIYIFGCKNWSKKVGKREIIELSEQIKATGAQRGISIATDYTRYAKAQAELDNRLELRCVTTEGVSLQSLTDKNFHLTKIIDSGSKLGAKYLRKGSVEYNPIKNKRAFGFRVYKENGEIVTLGKILTDICHRAADEKFKSIRTDLWESGYHNDCLTAYYKFPPGGLTFVDSDVVFTRLKISWSYRVFISKPTIQSIFEFEETRRVAKLRFEMPEGIKPLIVTIFEESVKKGETQ